MNGFKTLLWREYRSSWGWVVGIIGSLVGWAWLEYALPAPGGPENALSIRSGVLFVAFAIGVAVLAFMVGRLHGEIRRGEHRPLLLAPISGYVHILSRLAFAVGVGWVYAVGLGILEWITFAHIGARFIHVGAWLGFTDIIQLVLVSPTFMVVTVMMPTLAWVLLLVMFVSAYRLSRLGWLAVIAMCAGTPVSLISTAVAKLDRFFPVWHLAPGIVRFLGRVANSPYPAEGSGWTMSVPSITHSGDLMGAVLLTGLMLFLAGRLWEEVEG